MNKFLIETINVKKNFLNKKKIIKVFENVNIKLKPGELVAIIGPSGSGKSSLLHLFALLDKPTSGQIIFNGIDQKKISEDQKNEIRKKKISMIFQDNNLLSDFTAIENVVMPLIIRGDEIKLAYKMAEKILNNVKLKERMHHFPNELSGGEQQRVAIARALIAETDIILADEPTGNLDHKTAREIFSYFVKLKKVKKAVVFATHNRELANMADYKLSISNGNIKRVNAK